MAYAVSLRRFHLEGVRDTGRIIGEGAYAVVKELEFRGLKCVGKRIHSVLYENAMPAFKADMLQRFAAECELLGQLHHPHIVQFLGVRVEAGLELPELVMEYLPTTLRHCLDMHGILPAEISCSILLDVGLGLLYLHKLSPPVIHRDLSSNNVLLTNSMTAKISDLGVAKILDVNPIRAAQMTQTQTPGTPTFMPPEALASRPKYTCKVDIFSYGILMVHVLSGEWPIPDGSFVEDPRDPNNMIPVNEFERRRESIKKIGKDHPLLALIEQCLSNVANRRPDIANLVCQLKAEQARVPHGLENWLELLQEVMLLRAELQKRSGENEALRRNTEALTSEVDKLKINVTGAAEWNKERQSLEAQRASLARQVETLRVELARRKHSEAEVKDLREHVQRLTKQPAASPPQARHAQVFTPRSEGKFTGDVVSLQKYEDKIMELSRTRYDLETTKKKLEVTKEELEKRDKDLSAANTERTAPQSKSVWPYLTRGPAQERLMESQRKQEETEQHLRNAQREITELTTKLKFEQQKVFRLTQQQDVASKLLFDQKQMRGGGIPAGQRDSGSVAHDYEILFSSSQAEAVMDLNGPEISDTAAQSHLCSLFATAYQCSKDALFKELTEKLDRMLFMVSHGPPSQEIRQLAGAYGELIHLTHVNSYETLTKQQAAIESEVYSVLPEHVRKSKKQLKGLQRFVGKSVELTWEMVTLQPPMVIDMSAKFNPTIQDQNYQCWVRGYASDPERYPLYYLRPTMYHCYDSGSIAAKGWVGNNGEKLQKADSTTR